MNKGAYLVLLVCALGTAACTTTLVPLRYDPTSATVRTAPDIPLISVGAIEDARTVDHGPDWLGAIRGGYGNRLKTLRTEKPAQLVVEEAFADGLRSRGVFADPGRGKFSLEGKLEKLDCSQYFNLEAHAHAQISVVRTDTRDVVYTRMVRADQTEGGLGAGIFGSVETLRVLAERTLRELVDKTLDDPALRSAVQQP